MKMVLMKVAVGAVASGLIGTVALAQNLEEITVQGTRMVTTEEVGHTSVAGIKINDVSLSYGVSTAGLDFGSHAGVLEAQKRVKGVAESACKELAKRYPDGTPSDAECVKAATDKAMVKVNELAKAARKATGK